MPFRDPKTYRGGRPKRSSTKTSYFLTPKEVGTALRASEFARRVELPLNTHAILNFPIGIAEDKAPIFIAKTIKNLRQWLRRRGISGAQTTHLWVRETKPHQASHVHLLFHLPPSARLTNSRLAALIPREAGIVPGEVRDSAGRDSGTPVLVLRAENDEHSREWTRYVLKGISASDANDFGLRPIRQGLIAGKRIGVAENIGASEWMNWTTDYKIGGREFALRRWRERAEAAKSPDLRFSK